MLRPAGMMLIQITHPKYHHMMAYYVTVVAYLVQNVLLGITLSPEKGAYNEITTSGVVLKNAVKEI